MWNVRSLVFFRKPYFALLHPVTLPCIVTVAACGLLSEKSKHWLFTEVPLVLLRLFLIFFIVSVILFEVGDRWQNGCFLNDHLVLDSKPLIIKNWLAPSRVELACFLSFWMGFLMATCLDQLKIIDDLLGCDALIFKLLFWRFVCTHLTWKVVIFQCFVADGASSRSLNNARSLRSTIWSFSVPKETITRCKLSIWLTILEIHDFTLDVTLWANYICLLVSIHLYIVC